MTEGASVIWSDSVLGKTFLMGEYVALRGGPAMLMTTEPAFRMQVMSAGSEPPASGQVGVMESRWLKAHAEQVSGVTLAFEDPYHRLGGLGASSAWWLMAERYLALPADQPMTSDAFYTDRSMRSAVLERFRAFMQVPGGVTPSGYDLLAQAISANYLFIHEADDGCLLPLDWPFPDLGIMLCHTGHKLQTHAHLSALRLGSVQRGHDLVMRGFSALRAADKPIFCETINAYHDWLADSGWLVAATKRLAKRLIEHPKILACKGCGAGGSDVIALVIRVADAPALTPWLAQLGLRVLNAPLL
jgi:mevalonate kinase